ncbi:unnamed protein product, partial [Allacma fusca]
DRIFGCSNSEGTVIAALNVTFGTGTKLV